MGVMLDPSNYLADTRPDDIKFLDKVAKKLKSRDETTNSSVPVVLPYFKNITIQQGAVSGFGNFDYFTPLVDDLMFALTGKNLIRISELPELSLGLCFKIISLGGFQNIASYNIPIYFNLYIGGSIEPNPSGSFFKKIISLPLGNMTWNNATGFTWTDPSQTLNLKNYISGRSYISSTGVYDFTSNNTKITQQQYLELVNSQSTNLQATLTYDPTAMTTPQKDHFNTLFNNANDPTPSTISGWTLSTTLIFTYFGSLASFTPTIN